MKDFILASQSPRRKQLLEWAELSFEIIVKSTDELFPEGLSMEEIPIHIARQKAFAVKEYIQTAYHQVYAKKPILAADTVVILQEAAEIAFSDITEVEFNAISLEQIEYYVDQYEPYDKAGAYAIQEWIGVIGIKSVKGDFYNVMGLPINRVVQALQKILV